MRPTITRWAGQRRTTQIRFGSVVENANGGERDYSRLRDDVPLT
jgi:hypothetical protein